MKLSVEPTIPSINAAVTLTTNPVRIKYCNSYSLRSENCKCIESTSIHIGTVGYKVDEIYNSQQPNRPSFK